MKAKGLQLHRKPGDASDVAGIQVGPREVYHLDRKVTGKGWVMTKDCMWRLSTADFATRTPNWDNAFLSRGKFYCNRTFKGHAFNLVQCAWDTSCILYKIPKKYRVELKQGRNVLLCYNLAEFWKGGVSNRRFKGNPQYALKLMYEAFVGFVPVGRTVQKITRNGPVNVNNIRLNGEGVSKTIFGYTVYKHKYKTKHFLSEKKAMTWFRGLGTT